MDRYEFDFGVYECYPQFMVALPKEGAVIGKRELAKIVEIAKKNYIHPFGFIANRVHHSSGHLANYETVKRELPLLHAIAVVSYRSITSTLAETERQVLKGIAFNVVYDLETAKQWILDQLDRMSEGIARSSFLNLGESYPAK